MKKRLGSLIISIITMGLLMLMIGCTGPSGFEMDPGPSRLEMDYGTSFKLMKFQQTLNPEAEKNLDPVTGLDPGASKALLERYRKSFEKTEAPPTYTINVGGFTGR